MHYTNTLFWPLVMQLQIALGHPSHDQLYQHPEGGTKPHQAVGSNSTTQDTVLGRSICSQYFEQETIYCIEIIQSIDINIIL